MASGPFRSRVFLGLSQGVLGSELGICNSWKKFRDTGTGPHCVLGCFEMVEFIS